jgi:uncharacterized HAD superfamily protein
LLANFMKMAKKQKAKEGRPTKYKAEYAEQVYRLCLLGATDADIADFFGVKESTVNNWKKAHKEFLESIKRGKILADAEVAGSLFKRAKGYAYEETTFEKICIDVDGVEEEDDIKTEAYKKKVVTKEVAADPTSMIFWLKNRQRKAWRDKVETGITDNDGNDRYANIPEEKIDQKIQELLKRRSK